MSVKFGKRGGTAQGGPGVPGVAREVQGKQDGRPVVMERGPVAHGDNGS